MTPSTFRRVSLAAAAVFATLLSPAGDALAQARRTPPRATERVAAAAPRELRVRSEALRRGGYAVVIDLDVNRLYFVKGRQVLWSALVGTGTGLRMEGGRGQWDFSTPQGAFHVVYKEREPDWIAPDWYFVEHGLPVPGREDPRRRFPRGLGSAAVFIGRGLAIHGTDKPELLGQRVSHGCIRLSNSDALRLFHNVQVGTEVVIVGGSDLEAVSPPPTPTPSRGSTRRAGEPPPRDPAVVELEGRETVDLLAELDDELVAAAFTERGSRWPLVASVLLLRGVKEEDDDALAGLLTTAARIGDGRLREEYSTFLSDAYAQGALRTLEVMGRLDRTTRAEVARGIVDATLGLYPRDPAHDAATPWPTKRAPRDILARTSQRAWDALHLAEQDFRDERGLALRGPEP